MAFQLILFSLGLQRDDNRKKLQNRKKYNDEKSWSTEFLPKVLKELRVPNIGITPFGLS